MVTVRGDAAVTGLLLAASGQIQVATHARPCGMRCRGNYTADSPLAHPEAGQWRGCPSTLVAVEQEGVPFVGYRQDVERRVVASDAADQADLVGGAPNSPGACLDQEPPGGPLNVGVERQKQHEVNAGATYTRTVTSSERLASRRTAIRKSVCIGRTQRPLPVRLWIMHSEQESVESAQTPQGHLSIEGVMRLERVDRVTLLADVLAERCEVQVMVDVAVIRRSLKSGSS